MKRWPWHVVGFGLVLVTLLVVQAGATAWLMDRDALCAVLDRREPLVLAALVAALLARLVVLFVMPGWALYLVASLLAEIARQRGWIGEADDRRVR